MQRVTALNPEVLLLPFLLSLVVATVATLVPTFSLAAPTAAQKCEAAVETATAKFAECRLNAEAKFSRDGDVAKRTASLERCSSRLSSAFVKAAAVYGTACPATRPVGEFDAFLSQCTVQVESAAGGGPFPTCGDGTVNVPGEHCDGSDLGGASCASLGFLGGVLGCSPACRFDSAACLLSLPTPTPTPSPTPTPTPELPNPIAHWTLDEGSGTAVTDSSGHGVDGVWNGALDSWVAGVSGTALQFDGVDDYVEFGLAPGLSFGAAESFAISFWINPASTTNQGHILTKRPVDTGFGAPFFDVILFGPSRSIVFSVSDVPGNALLTPGYDVPVGQWTHVVGQRNRTSNLVELFVNGVRVSSTTDTTTGAIDPTTHNLRMGRWEWGGSYYLKGSLDDVRVYRSALTEAQVQALFELQGQ